MMNNMMKQSSIRKFVSGTNEPKLLNAKVKLIQNNTRPKPLMSGIKPVIPGGFNIDNYLKPNEPKIEQKEEEVTLNDMKDNIGKSTNQKQIFNQDLYNRIAGPHVIQNNNNSNVQISTSQPKIKEPQRKPSPAVQTTTNNNKQQNPLAMSDSYTKLKESYGTFASPSLKRREELMQFSMKKPPINDTSSSSIKKEGVAARMSNYNKNNEKLNRSRSNSNNRLKESTSSNQINKRTGDANNEQSINNSLQKSDSYHTQNKETIITSQSIEKRKEEPIARIAPKRLEGNNLMNQMIMRKKEEDSQAALKGENQNDNSFNQGKHILRSKEETEQQSSFTRSIIQKSDYPSKIFKKKEDNEQYIRATPQKIENSFTLNEINALTQSLAQSQYKDLTNEQEIKPLKKEEREIIPANIKKDLDDMRKKNNELSKENEKLFKEADEAQRKCQEFLKEIKEISIRGKASAEDLRKEKTTNDELNKKIQTMEEDIELLNEELSTKDLEIQVINQKFLEYQNNMTLQSNNSTTDISHKSKSITSSDNNKILDLEKIIGELTEKLTFLTEDKNYTTQYYKSQLDTLNSQLKAKDLLLITIPTKDDLIKQLTSRLKEYENIIETLTSEISSLSPTNNLYEQIIIEKDELETQYQELEAKYNELKYDFNTDEELIKEHESINKLTEKMLMKTQDDLIKSQKECNDLQVQLSEAESNERCIINKMNELKMMNNTIKEQIAQTQDNDFDMNDFLNRHLATNAKIEMYERQQVLLSIASIENDDLRLRNELVKRIIPKEIFTQASLEAFEKLITLHSIRKKTFDLIMSIISHNLLQISSSNRYDSFPLNLIESETDRKIILFYHYLIGTLIEYHTIIFILETVLNKDMDRLSEEKVGNVYMNILAANQFIDMLINQIKNDTLNIQFFPKIEGLKAIVKAINDQWHDKTMLLKHNEKPIIKYYTSLLMYMANIIKSFRYDKSNIGQSKDNYDILMKYGSLTKSLGVSFNNAEKCLRKINNIQLNNLNDDKLASMLTMHFDLTSSYYIKLAKSLETKDYEQLIKDSNTFIIKYERLIDIGNKLSIVISSSMEKIEKKYHYDQTSINLINDLPLDALTGKNDAVKKDLDTFVKIKDDLQKTLEKLKASKVSYAQLKAEYDELSRTKHYNDNQLAEMIVKVGRIAQLESSNTDYQKKIEIYTNAINDLASKEEESQLELLTYQEQCDQYLKEIEQLKQQQAKKGRSYQHYNQTDSNNCEMPDGILDLETLYELKVKERMLKSKLMKEKMITLVNDHHSNINSFIKRNEGKDIEDLSQAKAQIKRMNYSYKNIRMRMTIPSVIDLTKPRMFNDKITPVNAVMTENRTQMDFIKVHYMQTASNILHQVLGRKIDPILFWKNVDYGILKNVQCFNEKHIPIGTIRLLETQDNASQTKQINRPTPIPIFLSEDTFQILNKSFLF